MLQSEKKDQENTQVCLHRCSGNIEYLKFLSIFQFLLLVFCTFYFSSVWWLPRLSRAPVLRAPRQGCASAGLPTLREAGLWTWLASGAAGPGPALKRLL